MILTNETLGDLVYLVSTTVTLPLPSLPYSSHLLSSIIISNNTLYLKTTVGEAVREELVINSCNEGFDKAIMRLGELDMSKEEKAKRVATNSFKYSSLQRAVASLLLDSSTHKSLAHHDLLILCTLLYHVSLMFRPLSPTSTCPWEGSASHCDTQGHYSSTITLRAGHDVRVYCVEVIGSRRWR